MRLVLAVLLVAASAHAQTRVEPPVDVDGDGRPDPVARSLEADVGGRHLVLLTTARPPGEAALLAEKRGAELVPLWRGALGPRDVDGEWAVVLDLPSLTLYETRPDVTGCDGRALAIYPRSFDFGALAWVAATPAVVPAVATVVTARRAAPAGLDEHTPPSVLRFEAATTAAGDGGSAEGLVAPRELDDGRIDTAWRSPRGRGVGARFVARGATAAVVALRIVPGDATSARAFRAGDRLTRLVVTVGGVPFAVEIPAAAGPEPLWAVLPAPVQAACVEVAVERTTGGTGRLAISELAVLTDVDAGGAAALAAMAASVAAGGPEATGAEHHLSSVGGKGAAALVTAAQASHDPVAQARLRAALARLGDPAGAEEVALGLRAATGADAERLAEALTGMGDAAIAPSATVLADDGAPEPARVLAARILGDRGEPSARAALLAAVGRDPPGLRQAVVLALAHAAPARLLPEAAKEATAAAGVRAADLWRAVGLAAHHGTDDERAQIGRAAEAGLAAAPSPELRYRLVQALAAAAPARVTPFLAAEREPALRTVAIRALGAPDAGALAAGLADADPGVRTAALERLADPDAPAEPAVARLLAADAWPMVRRAAASALAVRCTAPPLLAAGRSDHDEGVRRAALAGLVRCKTPGAGPELVAIAGSGDFSPGLRAYAAALLGPLGDRAQVRALAELLGAARADILAAPDPVRADGPIRRAAAAAHALGILADPAAADALFAAAADAASPAVQANAVTALGAICPSARRKETAELLAAAAASDDMLVARAGRAAKKSCAVAAPNAP